MEQRGAMRNKTLVLSKEELSYYQTRLLHLDKPATLDQVLNRTICQDIFAATPLLPDNFVDLMIIDPPYNLDRVFNGCRFKKITADQYTQWVDSWLSKLIRLLKPSASVYICSDWRCSAAVQAVAERYLKVRNRITWEREKGRGALKNWKNCSEDIWFCTVSETYTFNVDEVRLKRKVIAPYRDENGKPKDWENSCHGNYRLTYPSNLWTDITVPFWSMPENTSHPTQKPEKLVARIVLGSSSPGDTVFDPFLGVGTTSVVAKKLGRRYVGVEQDETYCCLAEKRLEMAEYDKTIQGYEDGVFWERNTFPSQKQNGRLDSVSTDSQQALFSGSTMEVRTIK